MDDFDLLGGFDSAVLNVETNIVIGASGIINSDLQLIKWSCIVAEAECEMNADKVGPALHCTTLMLASPVTLAGEV